LCAKEVGQEEVTALTATGGLFNVGVAPGLGLVDAQAEQVYARKMLKDFNETCGAEPLGPSKGTSKKKAKNTARRSEDAEGTGNPEGDLEACESKEPLEIAKVFAARLLKYITEARRGWQELQRKPHARSLCMELKDFEQTGQDAYDVLQVLIERSCNDARILQPVQDSVSEAVTWFDVEGRGILEGFKRTLLKDTRPQGKKKRKAVDNESNA
jgi:hypothetical protein